MGCVWSEAIFYSSGTGAREDNWRFTYQSMGCGMGEWCQVDIEDLMALLEEVGNAVTASWMNGWLLVIFIILIPIRIKSRRSSLWILQ